MMSSPSLKRNVMMRIAAVKNVLISNGDSTRPCHSPCVTSNRSECSPSSVRPSSVRGSGGQLRASSLVRRSVREASDNFSGVDRARRFPQVDVAHVKGIFPRSSEVFQSAHSGLRSTESYAFCRSMKLVGGDNAGY